jgi:hypothetical protein
MLGVITVFVLFGIAYGALYMTAPFIGTMFKATANSVWGETGYTTSKPIIHLIFSE